MRCTLVFLAAEIVNTSIALDSLETVFTGTNLGNKFPSNSIQCVANVPVFTYTNSNLTFIPSAN